MKVLVLLAKGFETMEFSVFIDVLGWADNDFGAGIQTVTCGTQKTVNSTFNVEVNVDVLLNEVSVDEYAAVAIPGGFEEYGFYEEAYSEPFLALIRSFESKGKPVASICVAALPLAKSGILADRKATTYHLKDGHRQKQLEEMGVEVLAKQPIVIDRQVITSYCPETAVHVAFELLEMLTDKSMRQQVMQAMGY
ncbi:DJ-1/PfpI family protein [Enterococcus sp. BWM-S5]|uniref:DJ-1/PfpI family protein n=1 Tax=Enterococcus larvae TaxID=2794352 RepID=A0ABS4CNM7_9ENTE|nr:DJ-1/PfpI family protein [Enterococcus larvae]MBP1047650.1 DJ-1/PfpI family protein [Enterococcus larvae]